MTVQEAYDQLNNLYLDGERITYFIDESDLYAGMSMDSIDEAAERYISEHCDIIYYSNAIDFLQKHDPSLTDSLDLARDYGYDIGSLNSEVLATLLNEQFMRQEWYDMRDDVESIIDDIEDEYDDEE